MTVTFGFYCESIEIIHTQVYTDYTELSFRITDPYTEIPIVCTENITTSQQSYHTIYQSTSSFLETHIDTLIIISLLLFCIFILFYKLH